MEYAYPHATREYEVGEVVGYVEHRGMTLRDWFAGQALAGLIAPPALTAAAAAHRAYEVADAMLKERHA